MMLKFLKDCQYDADETDLLRKTRIKDGFFFKHIES